MDSSTVSMTEPSSLSLRAWPAAQSQKDSLPLLIERINEQNGKFRGLSEESLEAEIRALQTGEASKDQPDVVDGEAEKTTKRKEELVKARAEIGKHVNQAFQDAYMALDFVSLLLSKETPRQAELTISDHVKGRVPLGALGTDQIQAPYVPPSDGSEANLIPKGWKLQGLQSSASSLIDAASRLESEIQKETIYWEQLLDISAQGWSISKLPRERHTLGVRFGFTEAAVDFRDRGIAALRRAEDGDVLLDQGYADSTPKAVRVRIMENDCETVLGVSNSPTLVDHSETVERHILQARDSLFAEELFHELMREGRTLANRGIRIRNSAIYVGIGQKIIAIDLLPLTSLTTYQESLKISELAIAVSSSLHLLLSLAHVEIQHQRSLPPPPLSLRKPIRPPYQLLCPLLKYLV